MRSFRSSDPFWQGLPNDRSQTTSLPLVAVRRAKRTLSRIVIEPIWPWPMRRLIDDLPISDVGGKLQLRVNAEQRAGRWRSRTEVADETVPGADLDVTGGAVGAVHEHRT